MEMDVSKKDGCDTLFLLHGVSSLVTSPKGEYGKYDRGIDSGFGPME